MLQGLALSGRIWRNEINSREFNLYFWETNTWLALSQNV